jgi:hypothetical protein
MFSISTVDRFTFSFNKVSYFLSILIISSLVVMTIPQCAHADTSIDKETKVRNAVVHQLLLMESRLHSKNKKNKEENKEENKTVKAGQNVTKKEVKEVNTASKNSIKVDKKEVAIIDVKKVEEIEEVQEIKQEAKAIENKPLNVQQANVAKENTLPIQDSKTKKSIPTISKETTSTKNVAADEKEVTLVDVKKAQEVKENKAEKKPIKDKNAKVQQVDKGSDKAIKQTTTKKPIATVAKKTQKKESEDNEKSKQSFTPLVDILSEAELQELMQDVVLSKEKISRNQNTTVKPIIEPSVKDKKEHVTTITAKEKTEDDKKKPTTDSDADKPKVASKDTTETDNQKSSLISQPIPVGRQELGRNTAPPPNKKVVTNKIEGWIYLGKFTSNRWENQTLEIDKTLPNVGEQYIIKATMVNVRDRLPQKGKMGKVITAIKNKQTVKILQLRGLGRNRIYYWAKIEREKI